MIADFSGMVAGFTSDIVTRLRASAGTTDDGFYTPGNTVATDIVAVVIRGVENLDLLPAGERTSEMITIYTSADLRTTDAPEAATADRIIYQGETFEVVGVRRWTQGNYTEAVAKKVGQ